MLNIKDLPCGTAVRTMHNGVSRLGYIFNALDSSNVIVVLFAPAQSRNREVIHRHVSRVRIVENSVPEEDRIERKLVTKWQE